MTLTSDDGENTKRPEVSLNARSTRLTNIFGQDAQHNFLQVVRNSVSHA